MNTSYGFASGKFNTFKGCVFTLFKNIYLHSVTTVVYILLGSRVSSAREQSSSATVSVRDKAVFTSNDQDNKHQRGGV